MSTSAALATVTATLQRLLSKETVDVTTMSPSTARSGHYGEQINIFLYSAYSVPLHTNPPFSAPTHSGELTHPPLPLGLKYLITAYGANDDDISGQQLMGQAMMILHTHPVLGQSDIEGITPASNLQRQVEQIGITLDKLPLGDMLKLWGSSPSAEYRLSTVYDVSVVLLDSA